MAVVRETRAKDVDINLTWESPGASQFSVHIYKNLNFESAVYVSGSERAHLFTLNYNDGDLFIFYVCAVNGVPTGPFIESNGVVISNNPVQVLPPIAPAEVTSKQINPFQVMVKWPIEQNTTYELHAYKNPSNSDIGTFVPKFSGLISDASQGVTLGLSSEDEGIYVFFVRSINTLGQTSEWVISDKLTVVAPPSSAIVKIYDFAGSTADISEMTDYDPANDRSLVITWQIDPSQPSLQNVIDYHVYQNDIFLGRSGSKDITEIDWVHGNPLITGALQDGPAYGVYQFKIFGIVAGQSAIGPFLSKTVTILPSVIITDDSNSKVDLANGQDSDTGKTELAVQWHLDDSALADRYNNPIDPAAIIDFHIYVEVDGGPLTYLGRAGSGSISTFEWSSLNASSVDPFISGPKSGHSYQFAVFGITEKFYGPGSLAGNQIIIGPLYAAGPVMYFNQP